MKTGIRLVMILLFVTFSVVTVHAATPQITTWRGNHPAALSLTFDDGVYSTQYTSALPALNQRGFYGTFFLITHYAPFWNWWIDAANAGHEIGSHTLEHPDLTTLSPSDLEYELAASKEIIDANIPNQNTATFAYPYGSLNATVEAIVQKYYLGGRGVGAALNSSTTDIFNENAYDVATYTVAQMESLTDQAVTQGKWLIPCFHSFDPAQYGGWTTDQFLTYLDYLKGRAGLWIAPFGSVMKYVRERNSATVAISSQTSDKITLSLTDSLDDATYNYPLTLRSEVPANWSIVNVQQGAALITATPVIEGSMQVVYFDAIPDKGDIVLTSGVFSLPPAATNNAYSTFENNSLTVTAPGILSNDTDPQGAALTAQLVNNPSHGTLALGSNGSFTYTPATNYTGSDSFTYKASNGTLTSGNATVTITVNTVTKVPVANNDNYSTNQNTPLTVVTPGVFGNDIDPQGALLTAQLVAGPSHSDSNLNTSFYLTGNGTFTYFPAQGYTGNDSFTYRVTNGTLTSGTATVAITVTPISQPPVAGNDSYSTNLNAALVVTAPGVLSNDTDPQGSALTAQLASSPSHGTLTLKTNGSFTYTPTTNYTGSDSFTYRASNGTFTSASATVNLTVKPANQAPVAGNDSYSTNQNTALTVAAPGVLSNDTDPQGSVLTAQLVGGPSHGTLTLGSTGSFTYTPATNYTGSDSFTYQASDGTLTSGTATVTITIIPVNQAPAAGNDSYGTNQNTALTVAAPGVLSNDSDPEGTTLTAQLVSGPSHGTLTLNSNGSFTYTPATSYSGSDSFTYRASDGSLTSAVATVALTVTSTTTVLFSDDFTRSSGSLSPWIIAMGAWSITNGVLQGSGTASEYSYVYTPTTPTWTDYSVEGLVQFPAGAFGGGIGGRLNPATGAHYGAWIYPDGSLGGANTLKLVKFSDWTTWRGVPMKEVSLPSVGTGWHTLKLVFSGSHIQVYYDGTSMIDVTDTNFDSRAAYLSGGISGDMWTYTGSYVMKLDSIVVRTLAGNQAPVAGNDSYSTNQNTALTVATPGVLSNDSDPEGTTLTAQLVGGPSHGTLTLGSTGSFTYTPATNYTGSDSFTYQASDGSLTSGTATVTITIIPVNQAPAAGNDSYGTNQNTALTVAAPGVLSNDSDPEGTTLTAQLVSGPSHGTLTLNSNGSFTYTPTTSYSGSDSFTYRASDGSLTSTVATVALTVTATTTVLFSDDFTRSSGALSPWIIAMGTWSITNGVLQGSGTTSEYSYVYTPTTPTWNDYSVEGLVQFPAGAFGGGIGGRLNPATGAHYGAWIYPDGSLGGANTLKLVKFSDWTTWSGVPMKEVSLPSVGTGWHTLKLVFSGSHIQVYYDGTSMIDVTDTNFDSRAAYLSGGISGDMWTYTGSYVMKLDSIIVRTLAGNQ